MFNLTIYTEYRIAELDFETIADVESFLNNLDKVSTDSGRYEVRNKLGVLLASGPLN